MTEPTVTDCQTAADDALLCLMKSIEMLKILSADASRHQRIATEAVRQYPVAEGCYERVLGVAMGATGMTAKVEAMLAEMQPQLEALLVSEELRARERLGSTIN
jgi:hypothetical protein